jgi:hypothetical protein
MTFNATQNPILSAKTAPSHAAIALAILAATTGCQGPTASGGRTDIVRVSTFYNTRAPFLSFQNPPDVVPQGLKFSVFLSAQHSEKGVFGDGEFVIDLYKVERDQSGEPRRQHAKKWTFNTEQAAPYRSIRRTEYGWGYGFRLNWGDIDVLGKEIMVTVSFHRKDGATVHGRAFYLKVPKRFGSR